jgi:hypothetical protein
MYERGRVPVPPLAPAAKRPENRCHAAPASTSLRHTIQRLKVDDQDVDIRMLDETSTRTLLESLTAGNPPPNVTFDSDDHVKLLNHLATLTGGKDQQGTIGTVPPGQAPHVDQMRVLAQDGWVYGLAILRVLQPILRKYIALAEKSAAPRGVGGRYAVIGGFDWLRTAGRMAIAITSIDARRNEKMLGDKSGAQIHVGYGGPAITAQRSGPASERLFFSGGDPSYRRLVELRNALLPDLTDPEVAQILLQKLRSGPKLQFVSDPQTEFFDGFVTLLAGMEGSRNNTAYATSVMTLELIAAGKLTFTDAFYTNRYGGQYPMASIGTGPGNMTRRRVYIESITPSAQLTEQMRRAPVEDAVPIKEIVMLINWLREESGGTLETMTKRDLLKFATTRFDRLMEHYYSAEFAPIPDRVALDMAFRQSELTAAATDGLLPLYTIGHASGEGNACLIASLVTHATGKEPSSELVASIQRTLVERGVIEPDTPIGIYEDAGREVIRYIEDQFGVTLHVQVVNNGAHDPVPVTDGGNIPALLYLGPGHFVPIWRRQ